MNYKYKQTNITLHANALYLTKVHRLTRNNNTREKCKIDNIVEKIFRYRRKLKDHAYGIRKRGGPGYMEL
jgi:hypothetical protein